MEDLPEVVNLSTLLSIHPDSLNPPLLDLGGVYDPRTRTFSISPVDAIMTRMGAYDNMFSNSSTFKVELDEW